MERIIAIGDTHGRMFWKNIVSSEKYDKVIFIGDYFDSHENRQGYDQISNFEDILAFKKSEPEKVKLLFGNHDFHYLSCAQNAKEKYSGFQKLHSHDINILLTNALKNDLMQMCYVSGRFLFSHAGVTKTWCENNKIDLENIEQSINDLFKYKPLSFRFTPGENYDVYGDEICQTPIWIRPKSLLKDQLPHYIQVVGHTPQDEIVINLRPFCGLILIDALEPFKEYLLIEDGIAHSKRIQLK